MTPGQRMERVAEIATELGHLQRVAPEARAILDRELERLFAFHTEKCCDPRLSSEESARHKEARAMARGLLGFFTRRQAVLRAELASVKR